MELIVQKYGGTSVGSVDRIRAVAARIKHHRGQNKRLIIVVSAMAGETNRLVGLCTQINADAVKESDSVIAVGEQITAGLLAMELQRIGVPASGFTGNQAGIQTDDTHGQARIVDIRTDSLRGALEAGVTPVVPGFQGRAPDGSVTTLGRGGSDTTAVALAAALAADECQIYTDVDGIYTTDPRLCPKARLLKRVTFKEMLEMSSLGSRVLQLRSVEFAGKYKVPLRVLSSWSEWDAEIGGTMISYEEDDMEAPIITGITYTQAEAKITVAGVPDRPGIAHQILADVAEQNINIDVIVQNIGSGGRTDFSFTVLRDDFARAKSCAEKTAKKIGANIVIGDTNMAKISVVGIGMKSHAGIASKMFRTLAENQINIQMISTSEIKISVIIDDQHTEAAVCALHDAFELDKATVVKDNG